jgi:uncharacterized membrane protein YdjX (TVP38/TMEM64 family)
MKTDQINAIGGILLIVVVFILTSVFVQQNLDLVREFIDAGIISILIYIFVLIVATVVAPISAVPLIPVAVSVWGWFLAAIFNIIGWTLGSLIAFLLARKYGVPLVKKFVSLKRIERFEKYIPEKNVFWGIVFLRMAVPADILSYVLGLFSRIKFKTYALATLIGVSPFAFIFAYVGSLPFYLQLIALLIGLVFILIGLLIALRIKNKRQRKE